jgi:hypothetical protein
MRPAGTCRPWPPAAGRAALKRRSSSPARARSASAPHRPGQARRRHPDHRHPGRAGRGSRAIVVHSRIALRSGHYNEQPVDTFWPTARKVNSWARAVRPLGRGRAGGRPRWLRRWSRARRRRSPRGRPGRTMSPAGTGRRHRPGSRTVHPGDDRWRKGVPAAARSHSCRDEHFIGAHVYGRLECSFTHSRPCRRSGNRIDWEWLSGVRGAGVAPDHPDLDVLDGDGFWLSRYLLASW